MIVATGCGGGETALPAETLPGTTPCEKAASLAARKACNAPSTCAIDRCQAEAIEWLECVARDLSQCVCEMDGNLNCEGSFKPDEGLAKCIAEHERFERCTTRVRDP